MREMDGFEPPVRAPSFGSVSRTRAKSNGNPRKPAHETASNRHVGFLFMRLRPQLRVFGRAFQISVLGRGVLLGIFLGLLAPSGLRTQSSPPQIPIPATQGGIIHGLVKSGNMPLPGVTVTAVNT